MSRTSSQTTKISSFVLMIIFLTLAIAFIAVAVALNTLLSTQGREVDAMIWLLIGFSTLAISTYVVMQMRRRLLRLKIATPPITTTIECKKCGFKSVREFQRGDYIFKEVEPCQKCNDKMLITAIYREVREKEREWYS